MRKVFAVAAIVCSSPLLAQQANNLKDTLNELNAVTVTATKYSTKTTETGKVVTIITRHDIEKAGSRDLAQVITELGGVYINGYTSNAGKEKNIYLRGAKVDYTLITIDGVPVYDASGIGSNYDIRYIPIDNVERIEILKGSQSTLYGSDAIAGVINIITRRSADTPVSVSGTVHYGSFNTKRGNIGISGKSKAIDYNLGYAHFSTDGFSEAAQPATSSTAYDKDGYNQNSVQASLGIQAAKGLRIQPFVRYTKSTADLDADAFVDERDYTADAKNLQAGLRNTITIGSAQLALQYQYNKTARHYFDDSTGSRNGFYTYNQSDYKANEHFAEAFVVYPFGRLKLTAGSDFRTSTMDYNAILQSPYFLDKPVASGDSITQKQLSAYAALHYNKGGFSIEGGGRLNHHSQYGNNTAFNLNPSYLIHQQLKIFANLSTGYKVPSLYQLFITPYNNKSLQPESSLNLEGGVQLFTKDEKASLRATYFNRRVNDVIVFFYNPTTLQAMYINQDQQKDGGVELEAQLRRSEKLQVKVLYSYVDGNVTTKQNGKDTTYNNLLRRPKSSATITLGSQLTSALYVSAGANAVGKRKDIYFGTWPAQDITLDPYVVINFYAEYGVLNNHLKLFADIRNLTNKDYADIYGYNTARFNAYGGLRFRL